jgi:hypothetical protein
MYSTVILMGKKYNNQRGMAHVLLLTAAVGVIALLLISRSVPFKDKLFSTLFPKPASEAATYAGEIVVGPLETHKTINAGIAAAGVNYLIKIKAGTYPEQVEVNKQVTLQTFGDGQVWVDGGNTRAVGIHIDASDVVIDGIGIKNTAARGILIDGINTKNVTIQNSTIQDFDMAGTETYQANAGVASYYAGSGMKILNNTIIRRSSGSLTGGLSNGIWFKSNAQNPSGGGHLISGNLIKGGYDGIGGEEEDSPRGSFDKDTIIENNTIDTCYDDGIQVEGGNANIRVRHNEIKKCALGIATAPNLIGPIYIEYNRITEGVPGFYGTVACFKIGNNGVGTAYYTGNTCILPAINGVFADGWKQTNANQNTIISRNNKIHVSRYVAEITTWTNSAQLANTSFDNDCLYTSDSSRFVKWSTGQYLSLAAWKTATGYEANGVQTQNCPDPVDPGGSPTSAPNPTASPIITDGKFLLYKGTSSSFDVGSIIPVIVLARTDTDSANLFSAKLLFDSTKLKVVGLNHANSFVTNWVEEFYDNSAGMVSLTGGIPTPGFQSSGQYAVMTTINFEAIAAASATAINFENNSAIYRDLDNANILGTKTGTTLNLIASATPIPSSTPTSTSTPTPSATPAASSATTSSPTPQPTPSTTPGAVACSLTSATWSSNQSVAQGTFVTLTVTGSGDCIGKQVAFKVRENDSLTEGLVDEDAKIQPANATFNGTTASTTWTSEYAVDGVFGAFDPPEYFFNANLVGETDLVRSNSLLTVSQLASDILQGDGNRDGIVDLVDLSLLFSNYCATSTNCKVNIPTYIDFNSDNLINVFDFSEMRLKLIEKGVIRDSTSL